MTKEKKILIIRFILFAIFACILPFVFIAWRYELFTQVSKLSFGGWGLVAVIILLVFCIYVSRSIKEVLKAKNGYSMTIQVINGLTKVILPLVCVYLIVNAIGENIALFKQTMVVVIVCEIIAIPINPIPKWKSESIKEGQEEKMDTFLDKAKSFFGKESKGE